MNLLAWLRRLLAALRDARPSPRPPTPNPLPSPPVEPYPPVSGDSGGQPRMIRVTTEHDGDFHPRMMSYWANAFVNGETAWVFAGHRDGSPRFFRVGLNTGSVEPLGSLQVPYRGTTEGWHWSPAGMLYVLDGPRLRRVNPFDASDDVVVLDLGNQFPGCHVWQPHSSDSGQVFSATVRRNEGGHVATVLKTPQGVTFYEPDGRLDESQISRDGRFLLIKEGDDNRIIDLQQWTETRLTNAAGALGHSDMGHGFAVGENDQIGACVVLDLAHPHSPQRVLFSTWNQGYISVRGGRCLHSGDTHLNLVDLDTGNITQLIEHGGTSDYDGRVKASLSPCSRVATYMNSTTGHRDVYLLIL